MPNPFNPKKREGKSSPKLGKGKRGNVIPFERFKETQEKVVVESEAYRHRQLLAAQQHAIRQLSGPQRRVFDQIKGHIRLIQQDTPIEQVKATQELVLHCSLQELIKIHLMSLLSNQINREKW